MIALARMIPSYIDETTTSPGERRVFQMLASDRGTDDWIVLHSLNIAAHLKRPEGEADFVAIVPGLGVLVLEIKAHRRVAHYNGEWHLGSERTLRSPFKQASQAMHSLRSYLVQQAPSARSTLFFSAVIFTHVRFNVQSPEWHPWQVIDADKLDLRLLSVSVRAVLSRAHEHLSSVPYAPNIDRHAPTQQGAETIASVLRPSFDLVEHPRHVVRQLEKSLLTATESQYRALDYMAANKRVVFTGPAGTGKTVLALEAAKRESASCRQVLAVCFNNMVGSNLKALLSDRHDVTAGTIHQYMLRLTGLSPIGRSTSFWKHELPIRATEVVLEGEHNIALFDTLVIDEAQDLLASDFLDFFDVSLRGGLKCGRWLMFGDFNNQAIYELELEASEAIGSYGASASVFKLDENCRNTPRVVERVRLLCALNPDYSDVLREDDGVNPRTEILDRPEDAPERLAAAIGALSDEGFSNDEIAVISFKRDEHSLARRVTAPSLRSSLHFGRSPKRGRVQCCSVHAFKGMEAPAVVVTDIDDLRAPWSPPLLYTALSRAQHRLVMIVSREAGKQLRDMV